MFSDETLRGYESMISNNLNTTLPPSENLTQYLKIPLMTYIYLLDQSGHSAALRSVSIKEYFLKK